MKKKNRFKMIVFAFLFALVITVFDYLVNYRSMSYTEFVSKLADGEIAEIVIEENTTNAIITMKSGNVETVEVPSIENLSELVVKQNENGEDVKLQIKKNSKPIEWISFLGKAILVVFIITFAFMVVISIIYGIYTHTNKGQNDDDSETSGISFLGIGNNQNIEISSNVKFDDVAGIDEEKEQLQEIVEFLKNPQKYQDMGAKVPKGVLLAGAPGTGKTLLAKAIAGEAGVPFFQSTGSSFEEKYVGVGASRVRSLFKKAREKAPSIVFIDEIDAVGAKRYKTHNYSEQTLNMLLSEMDGFATNSEVIVIAATNHPEILDEAIVRPGRFDRKITIPMPDVYAREKILKVHSKSRKISENVIFTDLARKTVGFSGADLENLLNESAIIAVNRNSNQIEQADIDEAFARVLVGLEKKNRKITEQDKIQTAVHEAGHAIVSAVLRPNVEIFGISIVPRGMAGGYNLFGNEEKCYLSKEDAMIQMMVSYGGKAAEEVILKISSSGPSNDLETVSKIAYNMVLKYAMNGKLLTKIGDSDFDAKLTASNMEDAEKICEEAYGKTKEIISVNKDILIELSKLLMNREVLSAKEVKDFLESKNLMVTHK